MTNPIRNRAAWLAASLAALTAFSSSAWAAADATATAPATGGATATAAAAAPKPPTPEEEKTYLELYGWLVGSRGVGVKELGLTADEIDEIAVGMKKAITSTEPPPRETLLSMSDYLSSRAQKIHDAEAAKQGDAAKKLFADLDAKKTKKTDDGLYYEIIDPGTGAKPKSTDHVTVTYKGTFIDGTTFDETKGNETADFNLDEVVPGWTEGLQLIGKGGQIKLYVPAKLGYGDDGKAPVIPPNATLIFTVNLKDVAAGTQSPAAAGGLSPALLDQIQKSMGGASAPGGAAPAAK